MYTRCLNIIYPDSSFQLPLGFPPLHLPPSFMSSKLFSESSLVLPMCLWVWGHLLLYMEPATGHTFKEK